MTSWTDNPVTSSTHVKAVHMNELRHAVNLLTLPIGLPPFIWTDDPATSATPIRAVHLTEIRAAVQTLWDYHHQGPLPSWSSGSGPASGQHIRASDINDLRTWTDETDLPPPSVCANVRPDKGGASAPDITELQAANINGVRLIPVDTDFVNNYIAAARGVGMVVIAIVATIESGGYVPSDTSVILQVDNEPDTVGISGGEYADEWARWRTAYPGYVMIMAGLASGDTTWYGDFLKAMSDNYSDVELPDAVDIHPYLKTPDNVVDFIESYTRYNRDIPAIAMEWNLDPDDNTIQAFQEALGYPGYPGVADTFNAWWPWSSAMIDPDKPTPGPGIVDDTGSATAACGQLIAETLGGTCPS